MAKSTTTKAPGKNINRRATPKPKSAAAPTRATTPAGAKSGKTTMASDAVVRADSLSQVSAEDRQHMVQYAAYHIAEKDGFQTGKEQEYWLQAEKQIDELLKGQPSASGDEVH
ncbi:MAG: DUF2934 domain-containing protein [Bdellovibrionales bacterium]